MKDTRPMNAEEFGGLLASAMRQASNGKLSKSEAHTVSLTSGRILQLERLHLANNIAAVRNPSAEKLGFFKNADGATSTQPAPEQPAPQPQPWKPAKVNEELRRQVLESVKGIRSEKTAQPSWEIATMTGINREVVTVMLSQIITTEKHVHRRLVSSVPKSYKYWYDESVLNPQFGKPIAR